MNELNDFLLSKGYKCHSKDLSLTKGNTFTFNKLVETKNVCEFNCDLAIEIKTSTIHHDGNMPSRFYITIVGLKKQLWRKILCEVDYEDELMGRLDEIEQDLISMWNCIGLKDS